MQRERGRKPRMTMQRSISDRAIRAGWGGGLRPVLDWLRAWSWKAGSVSFRTTGSGSHLKSTEDINVLIFLSIAQKRRSSGRKLRSCQRTDQRPEPAAAEARFVSEVTGWLRFAASLWLGNGTKNRETGPSTSAVILGGSLAGIRK